MERYSTTGKHESCFVKERIHEAWGRERYEGKCENLEKIELNNSFFFKGIHGIQTQFTWCVYIYGVLSCEGEE